MRLCHMCRIPRFCLTQPTSTELIQWASRMVTRTGELMWPFCTANLLSWTLLQVWHQARSPRYSDARDSVEVLRDIVENWECFYALIKTGGNWLNEDIWEMLRELGLWFPVLSILNPTANPNPQGIFGSSLVSGRKMIAQRQGAGSGMSLWEGR